MVVRKEKTKTSKTRIARDLNNIVALRLPDDLLAKLQQKAQDDGCPVSILIRMILTKAMSK